MGADATWAEMSYRIRVVSAWDPSMGHVTGVVATRGQGGKRLHGEIGSLRSPREEGRGVAGNTAKRWTMTMATARESKGSGGRSHEKS
jgi:hypothetical protein